MANNGGLLRPETGVLHVFTASPGETKCPGSPPATLRDEDAEMVGRSILLRFLNKVPLRGDDAI